MEKIIVLVFIIAIIILSIPDYIFSLVSLKGNNVYP